MNFVGPELYKLTFNILYLKKSNRILGIMKKFTHVANFPVYMSKVANFIEVTGKEKQLVLDMPAGNGLFADKLRQIGFVVTCGDFNSERRDYVYVNMEQQLPFDDETFDFVTCMEGIEHVINPNKLIEELSRVVKKGGHVIITMPNVQNFYSRLMFLFTGVFYQFNSEFSRHPMGNPIDRGHISSLTYTQLNYLFSEYNLHPDYIDGDRFKKKVLFPIYLFLGLFNYIHYKKKIASGKIDMPYSLMINTNFFLSRSLIAGWKKR